MFMKVIHYKRHKASGFHMHVYSKANMFYVPDKKVILCEEERAMLGGSHWYVLDGEDLVNEAEHVREHGNFPTVEGVKFSDLKEFEYERAMLELLIEKTRHAMELSSEVGDGFEGLLNYCAKPLLSKNLKIY